MGYHWLLAQSHHILEVVGLSRISAILHVLRIEHERPCRVVWTTPEVELLGFSIFNAISRTDIPGSRVEIYQVSRREIHVLHICTLLVAKIISWRHIHILCMTRDGTLEDKL